MKKILKNKDIQNASLACIFESMSTFLILFCGIRVLTPSVFGTPLRSHYRIFSPQIMQESWLYILVYEYTKLFVQQIRILISRFFKSKYPLLFVDSIYTIFRYCESQNPVTHRCPMSVSQQFAVTITSKTTGGKSSTDKAYIFHN